VLQIRRRPTPRPVEIDDVQLARAGGHPAARRQDWIGVVDRLGVEITPQQADRLAVQDVDRRQQDHARARAPSTGPA
jgi:hypothetical protein